MRLIVKPLLRLVDDWQELLSGGISEEEFNALRKHERTGRPLGNKRFIGQLEEKLGKVLKPQKGGRPKKQKN
jgi:putative transposase